MKKLSRKQLPLYALSGFGLNLLNTVLTIYLVDALQTSNIAPENWAKWTFAEKTIVYVLVFSILKFLAQLIDGIIDIPFAALTDRLKSKWGKRRPIIFIGAILTLLFYVLACFPISVEEFSVLNSIYFGIVLIFFYSSYTLTYVTYYGTYSEVCENENDRFYISNWKAFIDTIQYALAYALIPLIINGTPDGVGLQQVALWLSPLGLLMFISVFMIKERSTLPEDVKAYKEAHPDEVEEVKDDDVPILESIKYTIKDKAFVSWLILLAVFFFGLQMFLSGQNVLCLGAMGLNAGEMAIINSAAFGPVPLMIWIYRKIMKKKGFRFAFQTALASFALCMITFSFAYEPWVASKTVRIILGAIAGTIGSYGIGAFFSAPYLVPAQAAADDLARTGKSHPSMYFAVQGLATATAGALSTGLIWPNLREVVTATEPYLGGHIMTYIVAVTSIIAIFVAFVLPKSYDQLGKEQK